MKPEDIEGIRRVVKEELFWTQFTLLVVLLWVTTIGCNGSEIPPAYANRLADAIFVAEGGDKAKVPYGILSVPVKNKAEAREVCLRTIRNNWRRWEEAGRKGPYLEFLARRFAPVGAKNDPKGLNRHWLNNVKANFR